MIFKDYFRLIIEITDASKGILEFECRLFSLKLCKSSLTVEIDRAFGIFQNKKK